MEQFSGFEEFNNICRNAYDKGFKDGAKTMKDAKQVIIDELLKQCIEIGDVVTTENGVAEHLVLRIEYNPNRVLHVCNIANGTVVTMTCNVKKTGKHFDVNGMFEKLR